MTGQPGTYQPINILKPVADHVWIVDGPLISFGPRWLNMPFPTRMTVIRLGGGALFIHSPTELTPALRDAIGGLGRPAFVIAPNRLHYWWVASWHAACPDAEIYLAPRVLDQAKGRLDVPHRDLASNGSYPWDGEIATLAVAGSYLTEFEFFHRASRTLVLTDLIENFEAERVGALMRLVTLLGGVRAPHGGMPRDARLTFSRATLRQAVETMLGWNPERIIIAHGRWFETDGVAALRRAFAFVLD